VGIGSCSIRGVVSGFEDSVLGPGRIRIVVQAFGGKVNSSCHGRERERAQWKLRASELAMILDGIDVSKLKRVPRYERPVRSGEEKSSGEKINT